MIGLPALIHYPMYNAETDDQMFPFRTMSMILSMVSLLGISHLTWVLFNKGYVSKKWDLFGCFDSGPKLEPSELMAMDPSGTKKYTEDDDSGGAAGAAAAAAQAAIEAKKPIRKPDPDLRVLQRQISFGSGAPLIGIGSLKKKQMSTGMTWGHIWHCLPLFHSIWKINWENLSWKCTYLFIVNFRKYA